MRDSRHRTRHRLPSRSSTYNRPTAPWLLAILLVLVTIAVFWQVQNSEFVLWDDGLHIFENPYLHSLTLNNILAFWREPYAELYIPLTYTLWALTAAVSRGVTANPPGGAPLDPWLFHTLNLLVHLLNVLVVWRILRLLLERTRPEVQRTALNPSLIPVEWAAGGGALLFAMHPLQVEAVAWATGLKDVLCGFLSFVAVWQYLRYVSGSVDALASGKPACGKAPRSLWSYWLATGAFMLALLAKPAAVVVPVLAWVLDVWGWPQTWRTRRPALLAWLGLAVLWGLFTSLMVQPPASGVFLPPLWDRPLIAGDTVAFYLYKLGVPVWLGPDYGRTPEWLLAQSWRWLTGLVPWGLAAWLWYKRTRVPWLVAIAGVFVTGLLPVLGLVPFAFQAYSTVADRYVYLAMLGPALALAWGLAQLQRRWLAIGCVIALGALGIRSAWQTRYWHDTVSLFEHTLTVNPRSSVAYNTLGMDLATHNRLTEATHYYNEALRWWPRNTQAHNNLGNALSRQGQTQEAIEQYREALRLKPNFAQAHNNLGSALADQGHIAEAISHYSAALRLQPRYTSAHLNLGVTLAKQGRLAEARQHFAEVLRLDPNHTAARRFLESALPPGGNTMGPSSPGARP